MSRYGDKTGPLFNERCFACRTGLPWPCRCSGAIKERIYRCPHAKVTDLRTGDDSYVIECLDCGELWDDD